MNSFAVFWLLMLINWITPAQTADGQDSIHLYSKLCWDLTYSAPDSAIVYGRMAKRLAIKQHRAHEANRADILLGIAYDVKARYDSAMFYYHQALRASQVRNDTMLTASALSNIGLTFWHVGSYYKALENFFSALRVFETIPGQVPQMASVYNNIGLIYYELEDYNKAISYFNRANKIYLRDQDTLGRGAITTNIAIVYFKQGKTDRALRTIDSSIMIKKSKQDFYGLTIAYNEKATMLIDLGKYDQAYNILQQALQYSKKINDLSGQAMSYQNLQKIFVHQGNYEKAIRYNKIALDLAKQINDRKIIVDHYQNMARVYKAMGQYNKAYDYYVKYATLKDSLISEKQLSNIYQLEFQHQLDRQQNEIAMLQERQELQELKIERQELKLSKRNLLMILIIAVSGILLLLFYMQYMKVRHRHKREMVMAAMQQKSRQAEKIIRAELNERKRISQEIHDSLGQLLSLIKMNLSTSRNKMNGGDPLMVRKMDDVLGLVDHAINELRSISQNMSPMMLREKGLVTALEDMVQRLKNLSNIRIKLEMIDLEKLDDELIENMVFSVVQESLNNAIKHAGCTSIDIQIVLAETEITVMVEDNGRGFVEDEVVPGLGIKQIRTKVQNVGGHVDIDSMPGRGTIVTIDIPTKKIFEV